MPPHQRHPDTQTGTPNFDPVFRLLLLIITLKQITIKHLMYMQKYPFDVQKGPVWFFFWFQDLPWKKDMMSKVSQVLRTAGVH